MKKILLALFLVSSALAFSTEVFQKKKLNLKMVRRMEFQKYIIQMDKQKLKQHFQMAKKQEYKKIMVKMEY